MEQKTGTAQTGFIIKVLLLSLYSTIGVLFFISWQVSQNSEPIEGANIDVFFIIAGMMAAKSFVFPMILMPKGQNKVGSQRKMTAAKLFVPSVISFSMSESVAVMGFVSTQQTADFNTFLPFGIASFFLLTIHGVTVLNKLGAIQRNRF